MIDEAEASRLADAGLAGAAAIGRDVDGGPGARSLSGRTAKLTAERELWGPRRTLFPYVATVVTWTPGETAWTFHRPRGSRYELGVTTFATAPEGHLDQLSGSRASIATSYLEVERPARVVRNWTWLRDGRHEVSLPPGGTTLTITLRERTDDAGDTWTTVELVHDGLPTEWIEDMRAWWTYQLDMADFRDFGSV